MKWSVGIIILIIVVMSLFSFFSKPKITDLDELVVSQLVEAGSDLSKPHKIDFFLYFNNEINAKEAKKLIEQNYPGSTATIKGSAQPGYILCEVNITMVPNIDSLKAVRLDFNELAEKLGGIYDGWGAEVEN